MRYWMIAGNWKMHKTVSEAVDTVKSLLANLGDFDGEVVVCPPFTALYAVNQALQGHAVKLGAQNVYCEDSGAFTGEVSPVFLKELSVQYVIVGHSERRHIFGEDNDLINRKVKAVMRHNMVPILCIGETLEERDEGRVEEVLARQLEEGLSGIRVNDGDALVVAYEPVWAIGTGKTATPEVAQSAHSFVRSKLLEIFGEVGDDMRILYGGSVKPGNIEGLIIQQDIDGALVGGASLDGLAFAEIVKVAQKRGV